MIKQDKENLPPSLVGLIKSDVYSALKSYVVMSNDDVKCTYYVDDSGKYHFDLSFSAVGIKKTIFCS